MIAKSVLPIMGAFFVQNFPNVSETSWVTGANLDSHYTCKKRVEFRDIEHTI